MRAGAHVDPWWAALTVWGVVNLVNLLQAAGFLTRIWTGGRAANQALGYAIAVLSVPAAAALVGFLRAGAGARHWLGPAVFVAFVALMVVVEYAWPVEFRSPARYGILVPYLVLFFGAILLMGLPMFWMERGLWLVTAGTAVVLLAAMAAALRKGVR